MKDKIIEIIEDNLSDFVGTSEAVLHSAEDIVHLIKPLKWHKIDRDNLPKENVISLGENNLYFGAADKLLIEARKLTHYITEQELLNLDKE